MNRTHVLFALLGVSLTVGCVSRQTGNEGNLEFSYVAEDNINDFNKPVGVGATLAMEVRTAGTRQPVTLTAAQFDDTAILEVTEFSGINLTAEGKGDGNALLEVVATLASGDSVTDSVNMSAATPEVLFLKHTCANADDPTAAYLTGSRALVRFEMSLENNRPVIGKGLYPFTSSDPVFALNISESGQQYAAFDVGATAGTATISSDVDDTTLDVQVVTEAQIDGITEPIAFVLEDIDAGDTNDFYVLPKVGEETVCQANVTKTVVSDTPEFCTIQDGNEAPDAQRGDDQHEFGWFKVTGVAEGECLYTVTYPGGNDGAGVSQQFSFNIEP
jgi:hypothetical protein